jgi:hypothetical protein
LQNWQVLKKNAAAASLILSAGYAVLRRIFVLPPSVASMSIKCAECQCAPQDCMKIEASQRCSTCTKEVFAAAVLLFTKVKIRIDGQVGYE